MPQTLTGDQLSCLASPACNRIFSALRSLGKASATEIGCATYKAPATVLYHLRALEKVGLVHVEERRPTARKPKAIFASSAESYQLPGPGGGAETQALTQKAVLAGLREVMRGYATATGANAADNRWTKVIRANVRLSAEDAERFIGMLEEASLFAIEHERPDGIRLAWSSVVYPLL